MTKLNIAPTPYNYGIWYEYASNRTPQLNQAIDSTLRKFSILPDFVSKELFYEFVLPNERHHSISQSPRLNDVANDLESSTKKISKDVSNFEQTLFKTRKVLKTANKPDHLEKVVNYLEKETIKVNKATESFNRSLLEAQEELEQLKIELAKMRQDVEIDPMTQLANRKGFERQLFAYLPYAEDDLTLLLIDIDNLGLVNAEYDKRVGTSLIRYIARLLHSLLPEKAFIARLEGGKFVIIVSEMELSLASQFAEKIRKEVSSQKIRYKNTKTLLKQITISIGVATLLGEESSEQLITRVQNNLDHAKQTGKNRIVNH
ncbi:GGDEF domain-containing protein [Marinomonas transparens]|nr:GGDEF domain-containing protein [Marinomonas transparens]